MEFLDQILDLLLTYWPFVVVILGTAAIVEAIKKTFSGLFGILEWKKADAILDKLVNILPETIAAVSCVIVQIFPEGTHWLIEAFLGAIGGSLSARLYDAFLEKVFDKISALFKKAEKSLPE